MGQARIKGFSKVHHSTPKVIVVNNSGLVVRQLAYCHKEVEQAASLRIRLQAYDKVGYLKHSIDARLSEAYLKNPSSTIPNQRQVNTLSGVVLQSKNVDVGLQLSFSDVRGFTLWTNDSLGNERMFDYDALGRVTRVFEKNTRKKSVVL